MPISAWDVPFSLVSPIGTLDLNTDNDDGTRYQLIPDQCDAGAELRVSSDDSPQADGAILHPGFRGGYGMRWALQMFKGGGIAVGSDRQSMIDTFSAHANAILRADGRIQWTPDGASDDRLLDDVRLWERVTVTGGALKTLTVAFRSRFPYAIGATEATTELLDGVSDTVDNDGDVDVFSVFRIHGSSGVTAFTLTNLTALDSDGNPLIVTWDSSRPGANPILAGDYGELDMFRATFYLNGNEDNLKAGLDPSATDFFPLVPGGPNSIQIDGADATVLSNPGYS